MKTKKFKKGLIILSSLMLSICFLHTSAKAEVSPRSIPTIPRVTFDSNGVDGGENIEITVTFSDTMNRKVPFTVELTRGAVIAEDTTTDDIQFKTNNKTVAMDSVVVHEDLSGMDIVTGQCQRNKTNVFKFKVEAPIDARDFQVIIKTDSTHDAYKTVTSNKIKILSGLTIEAPDVVNDVDRFNVTGLAKYKHESVPKDTHMFMEIVHQDSEKPYFHEVQMVEPIVNDEYKFNNIKLSSEYEDGDYMIRVYLWDDIQDKLIGYAEKDVKFVKRPDVLQVSIYAQQLGRYYTLDDPAPGKGVTYPRLYVYPAQGWYVPDDSGHGNHNIQSKVILKSEKEAAAATNAKFVVTTSFGDQEFSAVKSGTNFSASLRPLRTTQTVVVDGVERKPFINFVYTNADGILNEVFVGDLEPILDPSGYIYDGDTDAVIAGAEVTLYRLDEETNDWVLWSDPTGKQPNPQVTNEKGRFAWDVENGEYEVRVYHPDYHKSGEFYSTLHDPDYGIISVPPEKSDIRIVLHKQTVEPEPDTETGTETEPGTETESSTETELGTETEPSTETK